jgi:hypothetical protein
MSKAKHTPAPWKIEYNNADEKYGGEWFEVGPAKVWFPYNARPAAEARARADANLISAAPELLAELTRLVEIIETQGYEVKGARALIAKATGENHG